MKLTTKNKWVFFCALLLTGVASANKANHNSEQATANQSIPNLSYTAHGKTDRKTAMLFQQLMKNNRNLQISAEVIRKPIQTNTHPVEVSVNYNIRGKTSMETVKKLIQLFKNNKEVEITAKANIKAPSLTRTTGMNQRSYVQRNNYNNFPAPYQPFYYNGRPPVFIQGNTIWYPMPINNQAVTDYQTQNIQLTEAMKVATQ